MSNLGGYQLLTSAAKRVGGPGMLVVVIAGGGYICFRTMEGGIRKIVSVRKKSKDSKKVDYIVEAISVSKTDTDNQGLTLNEGDLVNILEIDKDAVLIEIEGRDNNPFFVAKDFLEGCINGIIEVSDEICDNGLRMEQAVVSTEDDKGTDSIDG